MWTETVGERPTSLHNRHWYSQTFRGYGPDAAPTQTLPLQIMMVRKGIRSEDRILPSAQTPFAQAS